MDTTCIMTSSWACERTDDVMTWISAQTMHYSPTYMLVTYDHDDASYDTLLYLEAKLQI